MPGVMNRVVCGNVVEVRMGTTIGSIKDVQYVPQGYIARIMSEFVSTKWSTRAPHETGAVERSKHLMKVCLGNSLARSNVPALNRSLTIPQREVIECPYAVVRPAGDAHSTP